MNYIKYKQTYHITLYGRNDYYREISGNASENSKRKEQTAIVETNWVKPANNNYYSLNDNSKIFRFNLNHKFNNIAKGSKVILNYARIPGLTNSYIHRTIRLCGAEGTNCWDTERGMTTNPVLLVYGEGGATDINFYNSDPTYSGLEVPETFLSKGYIEIELCTIASIADVAFTQAEIDDLCLQFIIYEPDEELTNDINLAPNVNTKSLGYTTRVPKINH